MKYRQRLLGVFLIGLMCIAFPSAAGAGDSEDSLAGKAAAGLLDSMPDFFKDVTELQNMSDHDKVNYVLTKAEDRIKEKVADQFKDDLKSAVFDYAKASFRASTFMNVAVPKIRNAYAMGQSFDWSLIDADITSQTDTKCIALKTAWSTAKTAYSVYSDLTTKGGLEAFKNYSAKVYDGLAEAYIPGWGYFKLGKEMVEILGNYVLSYATDTAVEGMLEDMFHVKSKPQEFAQWIINKSPTDIKNEIEKLWNEGGGYGRLWAGQGTDKGDADMKARLLGDLVTMRGDIVVKQKAEEQKQKDLTDRLNQYLQVAKNSEANMKAVGKKATDYAATYLKQIEAFPAKIASVKVEVAKEAIDASNQEMAQEQTQPWGLKGSGVKYEPFDHSSILAALDTALSQLADSGTSGYDLDAFKAALSHYSEIRNSILTAANDKITKQRDEAQTAVNAIYAQYTPQLNNVMSQMSPGREKVGGDRYNALLGQYDSLEAAENAALAPYWPVLYSGLWDAIALDEGILGSEEAAKTAEATVRLATRLDDLKGTFADLNQQSAEALATLNDTAAALSQDIQNTLHYPAAWRGSYASYELIIYPDTDDGTTRYNPGDVIKEADALNEARQNILDDLAAMQPLYDREKQMLTDYVNVEQSVLDQFNSKIPKSLASVQDYNQDSSQSSDYTLTINYFGVQGYPFIVDGRDFGGLIYLYRYSGGSKHTKPYLDEVSSTSPLAASKDQLAKIDKRLNLLSPLVDLDEDAVIFWNLLSRLNNLLVLSHAPDTDLSKEKDKAQSMVRQKDGKYQNCLPDDSDAAVYLKKLSDEWDIFKPAIDKMVALRKAMGYTIHYSFFQKPCFARLDALLTVPDRIKIYQDVIAVAKADEDKTLALCAQYYQQLNDQFNAEPTKSAFGQLVTYKVDDYKKMKTAVDGYVKQYTTMSNLPGMPDWIKKWTAFQGQLTDAIKKAQDDIDTAAKARQDQWNAQQQKEKADAAAAQQAAAAAQINGALGYLQINDPRLNTQSLNNASGLVQVDRTGLVNGALELTGRLAFMDNIDRMLISMDEGRTWSELPLNQNIDYTFTPIAGVTYVPQVKVRVTTGDETTLKFFQFIQGIVYQDIDYKQMTLDAVKAIADAYEREDVASFSDRISRDYLGNKVTLTDGVRFDFDMFSTIKLTIYVDQIQKNGSQVVAQTHWDKVQDPRKTGQEQRTSGRTTMVLVLEDGQMKIYNLRGNLIYATLSPDIAEASGLPSATVAAIKAAADSRNPVQPGAAQTEDAGGLVTQGTSTSSTNVQSGTFALTQATAGQPPTNGWIQEFSFSTNSVVSIGAVLGPLNDFRRREGYVEVKSGNMIQDLGSASIDTVTSVPSSGYVTSAPGGPMEVSFVAGDCYAIQLSDGTYALVQSTDGPGVLPETTHFKYRHQLNGTTSF
ncbi:MAG: hypothetical protein HQL14_08280 [Candidatus Omnitrophica bacterium]|nr:hypothetical protein [Candidatus Omnitrophota bacterium]